MGSFMGSGGLEFQVEIDPAAVAVLHRGDGVHKESARHDVQGWGGRGV
jgi:hypothetical protein